MRIPNQDHRGESHPIAGALPAVVALVIAAWVAHSVCSIPSRFLSLPQLLGFAFEDVVAVSLASVATVAALGVILGRARTAEFDRLVIHTSLAALWLAPLALFIRERSLWTVAITAALAITVIRCYRPTRPAAILSSDDSLILSLRPDDLPLSTRTQPLASIAAAFCVQTSVLAAADDRTLTAAALAAVGFSVWAWTSTPVAPPLPSPAPQSPQSTRPHSVRSGIAVLAIFFTFAALFPFLRIPGGFRLAGTGSHGYRPVPTGDQSGRLVRVRASQDSASLPSDGDAGIILWPAKQIVTKLVVPTPTRDVPQLTNAHRANPLVIPFNGVYWFFKSPDSQPPRSSRQAHVSPETVNIRSVDHRPLSIEAHDHLGSLISLNCCSRIQVAIRNADRYPETVSLELVLINTSLPGKPQQSLGTMMVRSTHPWDIYDEPPPVSETLNFAIPPHRALKGFDELKVVFRLDRARADAGAKMAIDHFVLIPRGL